MRRHPLALLAAVLLVISGVGTTTANAQQQAVQQTAGSGQTATSNASTTQYQPSNSNIDVRIGSPGANGSVTQVNAAGSAAVAGNANITDQSATQAGGGSQAAAQGAGSTQNAGATATTQQVKPSNENISVRIGSGGPNGNVTQTNQAGSVAAAGNINGTTQTADQQQGGGNCKCSSGGGQTAVQGAHNDQTADAEATTEQIKPSNSNISVRIGSPGSNGNVTQSNIADSIAAAGNANVTDQSATQSGGGGGEQVAFQDAKNDQTADADATTTQKYPSNENTSVRIGSGGDDGDVTQTNAAGSGAIAANGNWTGQTVDQSQGGGCGCHGGTGVQAVGQWADSEQDATADATTTQSGASNTNTPVRIGSGGASGDVTQINAAGSGAVALNGNGTEQTVTQSGGGVQAVGQWADNDQSADATAETDQWKPSNTNTPVAIGGGHDCKCHAPTSSAPSGGGDVTQINAAGSLGIAGNLNVTGQTVEQSQGGGAPNGHAPGYAPKQVDGCGCHGGTGVQAVGQWADSKQDATADATTTQSGASNTNAGAGQGGGDVTQANLAGSLAAAGNANIADQSVTQTGGSGGGIQAAGQWAYNDQTADATATTEQKWPSNTNAPVAIGGGHGGHGCGCAAPKSAPSGGGDVTQVNAAGSLALAGNLNWTGQSVDQSQGGGDRCKCHGGGGQFAEQYADNTQSAYGTADTTQVKPSNTNTPVAIGGGKGGHHDNSRSPYGTEPTPQPRAGSVFQANLAFSKALSLNLNWLTQEVTQEQ
ncbi:MAG: hypothetical protein ABW060_10175 [Solirubrobacteraceae bacterium]